MDPRVLHRTLVTSDLTPSPGIRRSSPRRERCKQPRRLTANSFVLNILTSKFFDIKILRTIFAEPRPSAAFRGTGGGEGTKRGTDRAHPSQIGTLARIFFEEKSTAGVLSTSWA